MIAVRPTDDNADVAARLSTQYGYRKVLDPFREMALTGTAKLAELYRLWKLMLV